MEDARDAAKGRATPTAQPSAMPVTDHPAPTIRRSAPRPRWQRLYYLLAAFDLVTVALSLALNHHTRSLLQYFQRSASAGQNAVLYIYDCSIDPLLDEVLL